MFLEKSAVKPDLHSYRFFILEEIDFFRVTENDGKYKGNTAVWKITCEMLQVGVL